MLVAPLNAGGWIDQAPATVRDTDAFLVMAQHPEGGAQRGSAIAHWGIQ